MRFTRSQGFHKVPIYLWPHRYEDETRKLHAKCQAVWRKCTRCDSYRHISWICTCITPLTYVHVWMHFEVKHPAHYQQYFHSISCYCARIYGHSISCTQVVNRHFGWQATSPASSTTSLSSVSTLHGYDTQLSDHTASYGRKPTVNCKASQEPRQGYMRYSMRINL